MFQQPADSGSKLLTSNFFLSSTPAWVNDGAVGALNSTSLSAGEEAQNLQVSAHPQPKTRRQSADRLEETKKEIENLVPAGKSSSLRRLDVDPQGQ